MESIRFFLSRTFYNNPVSRWLLAVVLILVLFLLARLLLAFIRRKLSAVAARTATVLDDLVVDILSKTKFLVLFVLAVQGGSLILSLPPIVFRVLSKASIFALLVQAAVWGTTVVSFWIERRIAKGGEGEAAAASSYSVLSFLSRLFLWTIIVLLGLDNLGINVTALITGLGIGGVALALAVQNILGDLFASLSIALDKPFLVGDFIIVDDFLGTIEHVGLKTTRLRSLSGEQLVFSNGDLLKSRIRNYKRMAERRVVFSLGVVYQTSLEKLKAIPGLLREILDGRDNVRFERAHFRDFGGSALNFEVVYWVLSPDYNLYMDIQQDINFEIVKRFAAAGIEFAYPTQTLYLSPPAKC
jgi:small-conductance mechanosensitive channel